MSYAAFVFCSGGPVFIFYKLFDFEAAVLNSRDSSEVCRACEFNGSKGWIYVRRCCFAVFAMHVFRCSRGLASTTTVVVAGDDLVIFEFEWEWKW